MSPLFPKKDFCLNRLKGRNVLVQNKFNHDVRGIHAMEVNILSQFPPSGFSTQQDLAWPKGITHKTSYKEIVLSSVRACSIPLTITALTKQQQGHDTCSCHSEDAHLSSRVKKGHSDGMIFGRAVCNIRSYSAARVR